MTLPRGHFAAVLAVSTNVGVTAADAAPVPSRVIAAVDAGTPLSAYGGSLVYSRISMPDGRFRLVRVRDGVTTELPVASRAVPFDVDLGPDARGRIVAVYSRCATEAKTFFGFDLTTTVHGRGCRIHRLDLATGVEMPLRRTHASGSSEFLPVIWKRNVAFARTSGVDTGVPGLWMSVAGRPPRRLRAGPSRTCLTYRGARRCTSARQAGPQSMDLRGERLAFGWRFGDTGEGSAHEVRLVEPGTAPIVVGHSGGGGQTGRVTGWPVFDGASLFYAQSCFGDPGGCTKGSFGVRRYSLRGGTTATSPLVSRLISWFTHSGKTDYELVTRGDDACTPEQLDPGTSCRITASRSPGS